MKKILIVLVASMFVLIGTGPVFSEKSDVKELEQTTPSEREMEWFCPWCGGPGPSKQTGMHMMRGAGQEGHGGYCHQRQLKQPLSEQEARRLIENYAAGNPNLKVGDITESDDLFVGNIVTRDGSLVEKLVINKQTGWMRVKY